MLFVEVHFYLQLAQFALELAHRCQRFEFLRGIHGVRYELAEKNLVVGVQEFFDYGEYVFCSNPNLSVLHVYFVFG